MTAGKTLWPGILAGSGTHQWPSPSPLTPQESYLSNIDGRVQTRANIHDDVCAEVLEWIAKQKQFEKKGMHRMIGESWQPLGY